jgi:hypothetical protein
MVSETEIKKICFNLLLLASTAHRRLPFSPKLIPPQSLFKAIISEGSTIFRNKLFAWRTK